MSNPDISSAPAAEALQRRGTLGSQLPRRITIQVVVGSSLFVFVVGLTNLLFALSAGTYQLWIPTIWGLLTIIGISGAFYAWALTANRRHLIKETKRLVNLLGQQAGTEFLRPDVAAAIVADEYFDLLRHNELELAEYMAFAGRLILSNWPDQDWPRG